MEQTYEERRLDLKSLVKQMGRGSIAKIASEIGVDASYVSRCLYEAGKAGKKNIGDEIALKPDAKYPQWRGARKADESIHKLHIRSERDKAIGELIEIANRLDIAGINKLTERASVLLEQHAIKETLSSSA